MELTEAQAKFKADYIRDRGYWVEFNDGLLAYSPEFLQTYLRYAGQPARTGPLGARMRELIYIAIDASATHMFGEGLAIHMRGALASGASPRDIIETLQIATAQGLDSVALGVGILAEEMQAAGHDTAFLQAPLSDEHARLKAAYVAHFGDWPEFCDRLLRFSPGYFEVMTELLAAPAATSALLAVERELIGIALNAALTQMDAAELRLHMTRALRLGAAPADILQVLQLTAHLGIHACVIGVPLMVAAIDARERAARERAA